MPNFRTYNQKQSLLLPPTIKDWIPKDHKCHAINDVMDSIDIECIEKGYSEDGAPAYNPRMLIKIICYAYTQGIRSSRKIEDLCHENIVMRYLSANQQPDHGTINLFRKEHLDELEDIFSQIVILCDGLNIIDPTDISIDGSIFRANASKNTTYSKEAINKIRKRIRKMLEEAQKIDAEEDKIYGDKRGYSQLPEKLQDEATRQDEIAKQKRKLEQLEQAEGEIDQKQSQASGKEEKELTKNNTHNITDGDAYLMKLKGSKSYKPAYNGQIATSNQIVTAYDVKDEQADTESLLPMIEKTERNTGKKVKKVKADSGYFSKHNMNSITEKGVDAYIPDQMKRIEEKQESKGTIPKYDRRNFKYNQKKDEYICPQGKRLPFSHMSEGRRRYIGKSCKQCSVRSECTGKVRSIRTDLQFEKIKSRMRKKLNTKKGKHKYVERMSEVEPPFGNIKYNQRAEQFLCRGKPMVKIEFGLSCLAHNFIKIANWVKENRIEWESAQLATLMRS